MARTIDANFQYALWYDEWDWTELSGRSYTRWGSSNNYAGSAVSKPSDLRMTYNPGQNVFHCLNHYQMRRFRAIMGFRAIVLRAHWYWRFGGSTPGSGSFTAICREMLSKNGYPDLDDCSMQYRDVGSTIPWFGAGYAPQLTEDVVSNPTDTFLWDQTGIATGDLMAPMDITELFTRVLLDNEDLWFELTQESSSSTMWVGTSVAIERPKLDVSYLFPVEMFPVKGDGTGQIDLTSLLNTEDNPINLGAYQRGQIGVGIEFKIKNFSGQTIDHIEVWDDYPEWTEPAADAGNGGSGVIGYVSPFEDCVSQKWTVKMDSVTPTDFEVKAEGYLDALTGLHPQFDAAAAWEGDTGTDWTSPGGELKIPAAAWSGSPAVDDEFVFFTVGNSTDNTWPADSNDQVEMAEDSGGAPGTWRPINAQRTILSVGDTVDAATITVTVKHIDVTKWPVNDTVFIADQDNIDIGTIKSRTATTIEIEGLAVTNNVYAAGAFIGTTLPIRSLVTTPWAQLTATSGVSEANKDRLYIAAADGYGFTQSNEVVVQSLSDPTKAEQFTIQGIQTTYLDLDGDMDNDYEIGATVSEVDTGEVSIWLRIVADAGTDEERKEFRLVVIA